MEKKILFSGLFMIFMGSTVAQGDTMQSESVASGMKTNAIKQAESTVGIQSLTTGGGVTDATLGAQSGKIVGESVLAPVSGSERMQDYVTTGGTTGDTGLIFIDKNAELKVGTPSYDDQKLDLGTGGIIPSGSVLAPTYKIERLPEIKY